MDVRRSPCSASAGHHDGDGRRVSSPRCIRGTRIADFAVHRANPTDFVRLPAMTAPSWSCRTTLPAHPYAVRHASRAHCLVERTPRSAASIQWNQGAQGENSALASCASIRVPLMRAHDGDRDQRATFLALPDRGSVHRSISAPFGIGSASCSSRNVIKWEQACVRTVQFPTKCGSWSVLRRGGYVGWEPTFGAT